MPRSFQGLELSRDESRQLSAVWACTDVISKNIASQPCKVFEPVDGTSQRTLITSDRRVWLLNTRPNPEMTAIGWRESMYLQAVPDGNAYTEIERDRAGRAKALWPLLNSWVTPNRDASGALVYDINDGMRPTYRLAQEDVIHLRGPSLSGLMGENLVVRAARTLGVAAAHERFTAAFYGRGAQLAGAVKLPGKMNEEQKKDLREAWEFNHAGLGRAHRLLVLDGGADFIQTQVDPKSLSLVEDKKFSVEEIARWFGVPPHKIQQLDRATFSNIEHQSIEFVDGCLTPWALRLTQELNAKLFNVGTKGPWWFSEIDLSRLVRGDANSRATAAANWVANGIKSRNEVRAEEGLDDAGPDADELTVQSNMTTLRRIMEVAPGTATSSQQTVIAALTGACARYSRRLQHRVEALKAKPELERFALLTRFRDEQIDALVEEMSFFASFCREAIGQPFNREMAAKVIAAHERGEAFAHLVSRPTQPRLGEAA